MLMVVLVQGRSKRQNNAIFQTLGYAARSFADNAADSIRLLKIGMIGIQNQRISGFKSIFEYSIDAGDTIFSPTCEIFHYRIVG
jgi:hypothetical protein